jgi:hypothetical protein
MLLDCPTKGNLLDHEQGPLPFRRVQPLPDTLRHQQLAGAQLPCGGRQLVELALALVDLARPAA